VSCEQREKLWLWEVEAECFKGDFEFMVVDKFVFVKIEQSELYISHKGLSSEYQRKLDWIS
jgi:hypothetical protein